jgi:hypothetical protein
MKKQKSTIVEVVAQSGILQMSLTGSLYKKSVFFFALIPLFAMWGFWVTYFTRPTGTVSVIEHVHGVAMFSWVLLLVLQAFLIRTNRRPIHRQTGKLAWVLGPLIIVSTIVLANYRLNVRGLTPEGLYIFSLQVFTLLLFTVCYFMALRHRGRPDVHARWMICTSLTMLDPIFARILGINFIQVPFETGIIQYITYSFIDLILIVLIVRDWKNDGRRDVFLPALGFALLTQIPVFFVLSTPAWTAFASWFMSLPLS